MTWSVMQVNPKGDLVLAKVAEAEDKTIGGVLLPDTAQRKPTSGAHPPHFKGNQYVKKHGPATGATMQSLSLCIFRQHHGSRSLAFPRTRKRCRPLHADPVGSHHAPAGDVMGALSEVREACITSSAAEVIMQSM
jgi:hypothetical protein